MNDVQIWVLMGLFGTLMFSTTIIVTRSFTRTLSAEIGGVKAEVGAVRNEIGSLRTEMRTEIDGVRTELRTGIDGLRAEMNARFETVDVRFAHLDRDITALTRRVMGDA